MYIHKHISIYTYTHIYTYIYTHTYIHKSIHTMNAQNCTHTRKHALTRTHLATLYLHGSPGIFFACVGEIDWPKRHRCRRQVLDSDLGHLIGVN